MAKKVGLFQGFSGINNIVKATRIGIAENGIAGLETANNVYIDASGILETVPDSLLRIEGIFHSCWPVDNKFYCIKDETTSSTMYQGEVANGEFSLRTVVTGLSKGIKVSYEYLGDYVYYSNGIDNGYLDGVTRYDWPVQSNSRLANLTAFVPGAQITVLAGRVLSISGNEISFTEAFLPGLYNAYKNIRRLGSTGLMIHGVGTGVYVSDEEYVYFLQGINPNEWKLNKVLEYPAVAYGDYAKLVDPRIFGFQTKQLAVLFNTVNGLCIGMATGEVHNLVDRRYRPSVDHDALTIFDKDLVVLSNDTSGLMIQSTLEEIGNKAVTEWYGGFDSLVGLDDSVLIGADDTGLSLVWGQVADAMTGLIMTDELEMLTTVEML